MPDGTPFDGDRIPWGYGPCEAWDDPETREVILQWGTRLGKTTLGIQIIGKCASTAPRPGLFATSTQTIAKRIVNTKIYPALNHNPKTKDLLPSPRWWTSEEVRLSSSSWYVAWSGSSSQLADLSAFYGWFNELDKWSMDEQQGGEAGEGDSLDQAMERFKEFVNYKVGMECSPSTKSKSRIAKKLAQSDNRRYLVPCPHCGNYQVLKLGSLESKGGIKFERLSDGSSDPTLARNTAVYICEHCDLEILDEHRPKMMQAGVWAPEGCHVDDQGRIEGNPIRSKRIAGFQLSSLYSLQMRWGDIAEKFVLSSANPQSLRMFINGWLAETWEPFKSKSDPLEVGAVLTVDTPEGIIPAWATHVFAGVDVQQDCYVYWVVAMDDKEREHLVTHGKCETLEQLEAIVITREFEHEDGGDPLFPAMTLIDSGYKTREIYRFCDKFVGTQHSVFPCKGANSDCGGKAYQEVDSTTKKPRNARERKIAILMHRLRFRYRVNPFYYEPITQEQIDYLKRGQEMALSLHAGCRNDEDLLKQLCNGAESHEPSKSDPDRHLWVKRWEKEPNDFRDAKKYARCAADVYVAGKSANCLEKRQQKPKQRLQKTKHNDSVNIKPSRLGRSGGRSRHGRRSKQRN